MSVLRNKITFNLFFFVIFGIVKDGIGGLEVEPVHQVEVQVSGGESGNLEWSSANVKVEN